MTILKTYLVALRTHEIKSRDELLSVIFFRPLCINKILLFIIRNRFNTTVATLSHGNIQDEGYMNFDIFDRINLTLEVNRCYVFKIVSLFTKT